MPDAEAGRQKLAGIAGLAGVSVSTRARALNGSSRVHVSARQRIRSLARSLNDSINLSAQNLRLQKNQTVAVAVPFDARSRQHISDPFFRAIARDLADALTRRDPPLRLPVPVETMTARTALVASFASGLAVDGLVACSGLLGMQVAPAVGCRMPPDLAVPGHDDMPVAATGDLPLTRVHQPLPRAGIEVVGALLGLLRGEAAASRTLPVHLMVRDRSPLSAAAQPGRAVTGRHEKRPRVAGPSGVASRRRCRARAGD
jgi:DNA-binding LacI/PurR family transcriptional regulator